MNDTEEDNKRTIIQPDRSRFADSSLTPDVPEGVARIKVFYWVAAIFLALVAVFVVLSVMGYQAPADKAYGLTDKYFVLFAGAVGFYLKERLEHR